jgi:hypothetical protein
MLSCGFLGALIRRTFQPLLQSLPLLAPSDDVTWIFPKLNAAVAAAFGVSQIALRFSEGLFPPWTGPRLEPEEKDPKDHNAEDKQPGAVVNLEHCEGKSCNNDRDWYEPCERSPRPISGPETYRMPRIVGRGRSLLHLYDLSHGSQVQLSFTVSSPIDAVIGNRHRKKGARDLPAGNRPVFIAPRASGV